MASIETRPSRKCNVMQCKWYFSKYDQNVKRDREEYSAIWMNTATREKKRISHNKRHKRWREKEQQKKKTTIHTLTAHEMMKTDTMQFELILLMRLTCNNNIQTIRFIPRKTNQIEAHTHRNETNQMQGKKNQPNKQIK